MNVLIYYVMGKIIKSFLTSCKIKLNKIRDNLEPIGLSLILISFGWQCFEENSNSSVYENHILNINANQQLKTSSDS